jgi:hypothetical protein
MTKAEQTDFTAPRELEKAVRADRDGVFTIQPQQRPETLSLGRPRWVTTEAALDQLDRLQDRERAAELGMNMRKLKLPENGEIA